MSRPTFLSLFSGAGGLDLGLHRAGWECIGQVEADPWRREILARHWPDVPRHDDVTTFDPEGITCDLICGGFPCQDVSLAGRRAGLAGERTGLFWDAMRIVDVVRPRFVLLENVVGLLSSRQRRDFPVVVGTLADLGYGVAWRVVNSQYFGVPQRRRRVFIVGTDVGGRAGAERAGAILSVGSRCERHPAAGTQAGSGAAAGSPPGSRGYGEVGGVSETVTSKWRTGSGGPAGDECQNLTIANALDRQSGGPDDNAAQAGHLVASPSVAASLTRGSSGSGVSAPGRRQEDDENIVAHTLRAEGFDTSEDGTGRGTPLVPTAVAVNIRGRAGGAMPEVSDVASVRAASDGSSRSYVAGSMVGVRRLTPVECCRLQGFPDDWFGEPNARPDGPRYAALGDAVTVPVAEWLGQRIAAAITDEPAEAT